MRLSACADAGQIEEASAAEMMHALGSAGTRMKPVYFALFRALSRRLGKVLAAFDQNADVVGMREAAQRALSDFGAQYTSSGTVATRGPLLVCSNHPGGYDALCLLASMARDDVRIIVHERSFLRLLPNLSKRLLFADEGIATSRMKAFRGAQRWLTGGGAVLHFGHGAIEPDPAFSTRVVASHWLEGTGSLARIARATNGEVIPALVSGVHSVRAKQFFVNRLAEARGITTVAPLLSIAFPGFRQVNARVEFGVPVAWSSHATDAAIADRIRSKAAQLYARRNGISTVA